MISEILTLAPERYSSAIRLLHWVMAIGIAGALIIGFYVNDFPKEWRKPAWELHQSLGLLVGLLLPVRLWFRFTEAQPALPTKPGLETLLAKIVHLGLYGGMLLMAGSGYGMKALAGKSVPFFGLHIPPLTPLIPELAKLARHWHEPFAFLLLALIALHVVGALKHALIDRNPIWQRVI